MELTKKQITGLATMGLAGLMMAIPHTRQATYDALHAAGTAAGHVYQAAESATQFVGASLAADMEAGLEQAVEDILANAAGTRSCTVPHNGSGLNDYGFALFPETYEDGSNGEAYWAAVEQLNPDKPFPNGGLAAGVTYDFPVSKSGSDYCP